LTNDEWQGIGEISKMDENRQRMAGLFHKGMRFFGIFQSVRNQTVCLKTNNQRIENRWLLMIAKKSLE
jgi:hypothetical protein